MGAIHHEGKAHQPLLIHPVDELLHVLTRLVRRIPSDRDLVRRGQEGIKEQHHLAGMIADVGTATFGAAQVTDALPLHDTSSQAYLSEHDQQLRPVSVNDNTYHDANDQNHSFQPHPRLLCFQGQWRLPAAGIPHLSI